MKTVVAVLAGLAMAVSAQTAGAYVVAVATTIPMTTVATAQDTTQLSAVVGSAIQDVLDHAIAFTPTLITLEDAKVVGDHFYILLLIADKDGESFIEALSKGDDNEDDDSPARSTTILRWQ